ncbi:MAG: tRNA preQ1(34) S-adenosylmethionine ribosyltransferase-isomerase QueA [Planctomycetota bacterium]
MMPRMAEIDEYDYELPTELIAQEPLACRTDARLLVVDRARGTCEHRRVRDLPEILKPGDCLAFNDTKVVPARLVGRRDRTGGRWQGLFLGAAANGDWSVLGKTRGKLEAGERIVLADGGGRDALSLLVLAKLDGGRWSVRPESPEPWPDLLERAGHVPLPPYIRGGDSHPADRGNYQTVFARHPGAVAAPTAGLHFTPELLDELSRTGVGQTHVTLHVGIGTFRPVTADRLEDHPMHSEWARIDAAAAGRLTDCRRAGGRIVAVGTTVVRTLESAAAVHGSVDVELNAWEGETNLFIRPPYRFRVIDALLTNFHLPKSTLLVLVRTFGGDELLKHAYAEAIRERYRFFSYGDAMLIV